MSQVVNRQRDFYRFERLHDVMEYSNAIGYIHQGGAQRLLDMADGQVFVYGTLMDGFGNNRIIDGTLLGEDCTKVAAFDMQNVGYPIAFVATDEGPCYKIRGECWTAVTPLSMMNMFWLEFGAGYEVGIVELETYGKALMFFQGPWKRLPDYERGDVIMEDGCLEWAGYARRVPAEIGGGTTDA